MAAAGVELGVGLLMVLLSVPVQAAVVVLASAAAPAAMKVRRSMSPPLGYVERDGMVGAGVPSPPRL
ncbi:hypothetical protein Stsp02_55110 [Streptomyces sp. NBRC 14336]|nr:hypothetical protein Stsp02_55110 [Streptomyces sp. NBRC 14336]